MRAVVVVELIIFGEAVHDRSSFRALRTSVRDSRPDLASLTVQVIHDESMIVRVAFSCSLRCPMSSRFARTESI